jgi:hypothetical protein
MGWQLCQLTSKVLDIWLSVKTTLKQLNPAERTPVQVLLRVLCLSGLCLAQSVVLGQTSEVRQAGILTLCSLSNCPLQPQKTRSWMPTSPTITPHIHFFRSPCFELDLRERAPT